MKAKNRIGIREVRALKPGEIVWDGFVTGFGARRQTGPAVIYVLKYRTAAGRQRFHSIGRHGSPWTPETARNEAMRLLGVIIKGDDPGADRVVSRSAMTMGELCDLYLAESEAGRLLTRRKIAKRESTLISDRGRIARHIKPILGRMTVAAVTADDVESMMHAIAAGTTATRAKTKPRGLSVVRGGRGVATRTVGLLGAIFTYAIRKKFRVDNPVRGVMRFADGRRQRRLTDQEYCAIGTALEKAAINDMRPAVIAATKFMILTGWRRGEVLGLRWSEIDLDRRTARLTDTKTGFSMRALPKMAWTVLQTLGRTGDLVFPNKVGGIMVGYRKSWLKLARLGELPGDITPHVLRHSFASLAGDLGYSEGTIATLIGHKGHSITSRYVHSADAVLLAAADAVADATKKLLGLGIAPHGNPPIFDATSSNSVATTRTHPKPSHEGPTFISI
jgi:integrase